MLNKRILIKAIDSNCLDKRILANAAAQQVDIGQWIFERINIKEGSKVLELCCGTGAQTVEIAKRVGKKGLVVALDMSKESLDSLSAKVDDNLKKRMILCRTNMDTFGRVLEKLALKKRSFNLIFCAYGLYYSKDAINLLNEAKTWLKPDGEIVVVGPHGANNGPLFNILQKSGVEIPEYVMYTSKNFMYDKVIQWGSANFHLILLHTLVNPVKWNKPKKVIDYWQNSTFYFPNKHRAVENSLTRHFKRHREFVNKKWVMMVVMRHEQE